MQLLLNVLVLLLAFGVCVGETLFDFDVLDSKGDMVSLSKFNNAKAVLVVNVASNCGFTYTNYKDLRELYDAYHDKGLEILAFPSNQFAQEPGTDAEIQAFCDSYGVTFPVFSKVKVNGAAAHPLYKYLKKRTGGTEVRWNFVKFLVVNGVPVERFQNTVKTKDVLASILPYLGAEPHNDEL